MTDEEHINDHGYELHVHHIKPIREFDEPEEANVLSNLVTLCHEHHNIWEGTYLRPVVRKES